MTKRNWFLVYACLFTVWSLDALTKQWALDIRQPMNWGPVYFFLHFNPGAILGTFSHLPPVLRVVTLSTGGAFLIFTFIALNYVLSARALTLRVGMAILLGGILGNVTDRILWGHVVDFLVINFGNRYSPAFNVADALQWVGYFLIVFTVFKEGKVLWPTQNLRKSFLVNPSYQLRYGLKLAAFGFSFAVIAGTLSFTYLKVTLDSFADVRIHQAWDIFLFPFLVTFILVSTVFCSLLFYLGVVLSHRAAGPIFAFEKFLEDLFRGHPRNLRLRQGDEFRHLEEIADQIVSRWPHGLPTNTSEPQDEAVIRLPQGRKISSAS